MTKVLPSPQTNGSKHLRKGYQDDGGAFNEEII